MCVNDPNNAVDPITGKPLKVYKPSLNAQGQIACVYYTQRSFYRTVGNIFNPIIAYVGVGSPIAYTVLDTRDVGMEGCINAAMREWTSSCDLGSNKLQYTSTSWLPEPNGCCLRIQWSSDDTEVKIPDENGDAKDALAVTWIPGDSQTSCDGVTRPPKCVTSSAASFPRISINQTPSFRGQDKDGIPTTFFTNNLGGLPVETVAGRMAQLGYKYYDLCSTLKHEFGHVFGMAHDDGKDGNGETCEDAPSIMRSSQSAWTPYSLHPSDRCKFKKLYCCSQTMTSVVEQIDGWGAWTGRVFENCNSTSGLAMKVYDLEGRLLVVDVLPCTTTLEDLGNQIRIDSGFYIIHFSTVTEHRVLKLSIR